MQANTENRLDIFKRLLGDIESQIPEVQRQYDEVSEKLQKLNSEASYLRGLIAINSQKEAFGKTNPVINVNQWVFAFKSKYLKDKVFEYFDLARKPSEAEEIANVLLDGDKDIDKLKVQVSSILSRYNKDGLLKRIGSKKNAIWVKTEWLDENENLKEEYKK